MTQKLPVTPVRTMDDKMDEILLHLRRMDRRDRLRTWGGFVRALISLIPILILIWSIWYFAEHGQDLMKEIANTAASSAAEYTKGQSKSLYDEILNKYQVPGR